MAVPLARSLVACACLAALAAAGCDRPSAPTDSTDRAASRSTVDAAATRSTADAAATRSTVDAAATRSTADAAATRSTVDGAALPDAGPPLHLVTRGGQAMGTYLLIRIWTRDDAGADRAIVAAFDEIARLEALMSTWRPESDVSRVNAAAGIAPVAVSPEVLDCVSRSLEYSRLSGGAFDVSFYALRGQWKFDEGTDARLPDPAELRRRLRLVDWRKILVDRARSTIFLRERGMAINLGGIGKGYAVDRATKVLRDRGFRDAIVQAGGDLMLSGSKSGAPWQAGIRDPRGPADDYFAWAGITDHAFSTAGDYERFFVLDGKRYHHIIDPRTGWPATASRSVTIFARDATLADGIDDAVFILGPRRGMALVESLPDAGAVIVDAQNRVHISSRLKPHIQLRHPPTP